MKSKKELSKSQQVDGSRYSSYTGKVVKSDIIVVYFLNDKKL